MLRHSSSTLDFVLALTTFRSESETPSLLDAAAPLYRLGAFRIPIAPTPIYGRAPFHSVLRENRQVIIEKRQTSAVDLVGTPRPRHRTHTSRYGILTLPAYRRFPRATIDSTTSRRGGILLEDILDQTSSPFRAVAHVIGVKYPAGVTDVERLPQVFIQSR